MSESPDGGIKQLNSCFVTALTCLLPTAATFIHWPAAFFLQQHPLLPQVSVGALSRDAARRWLRPHI